MEGIVTLLLLCQELKKVDVPPSKAPIVKVEGKPSSTSVLTDENAFAILSRSSVRVVAVSLGGLIDQGSGTVVRKSKENFHVLTCSHVVQSAVRGSRLSVVHGKSPHTAKLLVYCPVRDLALLECKGETSATPATIAQQESYTAGTPLFRCGYPRAGARKVVKGKVLSTYATPAGHPSIRILVATPPSISGDSGGGVFRASDGHLIGVNYATGPHSMSAARLEGIWKVIKHSEVKWGVETLPQPKEAKEK